MNLKRLALATMLIPLASLPAATQGADEAGVSAAINQYFKGQCLH